MTKENIQWRVNTIPGASASTKERITGRSCCSTMNPTRGGKVGQTWRAEMAFWTHDSQWAGLSPWLFFSNFKKKIWWIFFSLIFFCRFRWASPLSAANPPFLHFFFLFFGFTRANLLAGQGVFFDPRFWQANDGVGGGPDRFNISKPNIRVNSQFSHENRRNGYPHKGCE